MMGELKRANKQLKGNIEMASKKVTKINLLMFSIIQVVVTIKVEL